MIQRQHTGAVALRLGVLLLTATTAVWVGCADAVGAAENGSTAVPATLRLATIRGQAAEADAVYGIDAKGRGVNRRHGLDLVFTPQGARVRGTGSDFTLYLERFGRGAGWPVLRSAPRIEGAWVEYERGAGLIEWFVNVPAGVEQGWTVAERPPGEGPLVLELDTARAPEESAGHRLAWSGLAYHRLVAYDAAGRELSARLRHDGRRLRIEVDDRDAVYPLLIDPWLEQQKLSPEDAGDAAHIGFDVAVDGDTALVGAFTADPPRVYVYVRGAEDWELQATLMPDGPNEDAFGRSVSLSGDTALISETLRGVDAGEQGSAYIFTRSGGTWTQQARLSVEDAEYEGFGSAVAIDGDTALVAEWDASVFVFVREGGEWTQQAEFVAGDPDEASGIQVAIDGDTAFVGIPRDYVDGVPLQGAVYVFTRSAGTWTAHPKLIAEDGNNHDNFGYAVTLEGDVALVGAPFADEGEISPGATYVFTRSAGVWSQQARLVAADGGHTDAFGNSVALLDGVALIGAHQADDGDASNQGAAYVFVAGGGVWSAQAKLVATDGAEQDRFGAAVGLTRGTAFVGAPQNPTAGVTDRGMAYVFEFEGSFATAGLEVDPPGLAPGGNGVFEPGETVDVVPAWSNEEKVAAGLTGVATGFSGPGGGLYTIQLADADYGFIPPGETANCLATDVCYRLAVGDPASRPAQHWDAELEESLDDLDGMVQHWTLHLGDSFTDVPRTSNFYPWVETVLHHGLTSGCGNGAYCPTGTSTRGQMPVFVLRAFLGAGYTPEPCIAGQETFADVPAAHDFCPWVEELVARGVVSGCGGGNYCPGTPVTRAQMAVYLLRTLEGPEYLPPPCTGIFADVACPSPFAAWVEELYLREVTAGCNQDPLAYCPGGTNIRGQMAVFLGKAFGLQLYGP